MDKIENIRFTKLILYPFVLLWEVYMAGFHVIKLIFTGAEAEMIRVKTSITNETLKIILVDSVTLTPGTIHVRLEGDEFTLLWLRDKHDAALPVAARDKMIKGRLEKWLLKAQVTPLEGKDL
jgi:multicomponent Na+:H+ antiporter subunit E